MGYFFFLKNGVCPFCAMRVGVVMVGHMTIQHGIIFKMHERIFRRGGSHSTLFILRKELLDGNIKSLLGGSSCIVSSSSTTPDPLLSAFIYNYNMPMVDESERIKLHSSTETSLIKESSNKNVLERNVQPSLPLLDKDQEEKARSCKFVKGLLLSPIRD
ncbi:hypothetical protein HHK36_020833 [Tetracentron sinense]|uniref:Di19 C-terminal domain-containing protein n=1 Tax=Tetracentron sinense TaxID=13715 RepID=A0A834YSE8_TETSI|nr:hypothetical protein HHK36_020833 [Tetracentron sinense]